MCTSCSKGKNFNLNLIEVKSYSDLPIDVTKMISPKTQKINKGTNLNDGKESLPSLSANRQSKNVNNPSITNFKETNVSTRNRTSAVGGLFKKISLIEFTDKTNSIEYYLNNSIKNKNKEIGNSTINNNFTSSPMNKKISSEEIENPYNLGEYLMPLLDEENIIKILKSYDYFQDQNIDIFSMVIGEIMYISAVKGAKIYEANDLSNFFYIINKGRVKLIKSESSNHLPSHSINEDANKNKENNINKKNIFGPGESFGEISFYNGKKRHETMIAEENVELYVIDSEDSREFLKRNNEIILKEKYNFLNNISIFESLDKISKYNVAQKLKKKEFPANTKIIKRGEVGETLYIIKEGIVSCRIGVKEIRKLSNNEYFGQNAILIEVKRGADIITMNRCICYEITKNDLKEALSDDYIDVILFCFFNYCINNNTYMKQIIIDSLINNIYRCFSINQYSKNEHIYNSKGSNELKRNKKRLIIVVEGSIYQNGNLIADKGKILGEEIFQDYNNKDISDKMVAYPDCITLEASIDDLAKVMKIDLNKEKAYNILRYINKLRKSYLFKNLSEYTLESIAKNMKKEKFNKGDKIIEEGTYGNTFYLISKGKVSITKEGKHLRYLEQGECLGEKSLLSNDSLRTATATAEDKVICYVIYKKEFDMILSDPNTREYLLKKLALQNTDIQLNDLYYIKFLGKGKFGSVSLVHNKQNIYAIKAISIRMVEKEKMLWKYFVNERNIMLSLDHPFIVKMVKSLRNTKYCFILMEFVNELNLDQHLSQKRLKKNVYETQFYIGSMLLMLDYLQKKYIAHRDIKPSNIMIDTNGYLKMIDFGTAKVLKDYTSTIIGTPHYISPEILQGKGYSLSCDFWSLGICMFEIFYGIYPFGNYANEVIDIYKEVLKKNLIFPSVTNKFETVNNFIKELLTKKVNERLCNVTKLKQKPFFDGFEFNKLNDFQLEPPFKPVKNDLSKYLKNLEPYENIFKNEKESIGPKKKKNKEEDEYSDYDPNWVEVF